MLDVAGADPFDEAGRVLLRPLGLRPELVLVEVVALREAGDVLLRLGAEQAAGATLAGQRAVEPAERLHADEVPQHEHVERNLEPQLGLDLRRRERGLARLVVLHDPARAERVDVDPVDLPGQREAVDPEPALELWRRPLGAERDLELARDETERRLGFFADEVLQVAPHALFELAPLEVAELDPDAALDRLRQALAQELERLVEPLRIDTLGADALRQAGVELEQGLVRDRPAQSGVDLAVDRARADQPLDEPDRGAVRERLQLGHGERLPGAELVEQHGVGQMRGPRERAERPDEPAIPAVRVRERVCLVLVTRGQRGQRPEALPFGGRRLDPPGELGQRPALRPARDVGGLEERAGLVPERARLARRAVVGRRLADEVQAPRRASARGVEEVALARDRVRPGQPRAARGVVDLAALLVREEGRALLPSWEAPLLETEQEDDLGSPRSRSEQVGDCDPTRLVTTSKPKRGSVERAVQLLAGERPAEIDPAAELVEQVVHGPVGTEVEDGVLADGRRFDPVGGADHRADECAHRVERLGLGPEGVEHPQRLSAQLQRLLDHPRRLADRAAAQPSFEVVDVRAGQARERGAQEAVEVVPAAGEPLEPKEREERLAERRLADPDPALDRVRHLEGAKRGLELSPLPLDARADEEDLLGLRPGSDQLQHLVGDELERAARARPFEETNRSPELWRRRRPVDEEVPLEVRELRGRNLRVARRELFDPTRCQRAQVLGRARQRLEWSAIRLVRERDHDLGAAGERFEQRPLRTGQVLEAVGKHGPVRPGPEFARDEVGRVAPAQVSVPEPELLELGAVRRVEEREIAAQLVGLDEPRLKLR